MDHNAVEKPHCTGCGAVFNSNLALESHLITCIKPKAGVTFSHMWKMAPSTTGKPLAFSFLNTDDNVDKILPLSHKK